MYTLRNSGKKEKRCQCCQIKHKQKWHYSSLSHRIASQRQQNRMYLLFTRWQPWQPVTTQQQNNKTSLLSLRFAEVHFINKRRRFFFTARKKELQPSKHNATICVHYSCDISDNCQQCSTNKWYVCSQVRYELKSFVHTHTRTHACTPNYNCHFASVCVCVRVRVRNAIINYNFTF